jgi:formate-dependent nitrite reductase membrane component NrfD
MDELDFVSWKIVQLVLWAGPLGVGAFLAGIAATAFYAGYSMRRKAKQDKPMGAQKLDHIKYDILHDGTLGPGDNRGLEGPE